MAQRVLYFEDNPQYLEGPFVAVNAGGWRIESEFKDHQCPVLPDISIYQLLEKEKGKKPGKLSSFEEIAPYVDWLNEQVKNGKIGLVGRAYKVL